MALGDGEIGTHAVRRTWGHFPLCGSAFYSECGPTRVMAARRGGATDWRPLLRLRIVSGSDAQPSCAGPSVEWVKNA